MLDIKLYPLLFNDEVLGCDLIDTSANSEAYSAVRYKVSLNLLKKVMKLSGEKIIGNFKNYCLKNRLIELSGSKEYCQIISSLEDNDVILADAYKSGDEFNFFNLSAFYISNKNLKTYWNIEFLNYCSSINNNINALMNVLDDAIVNDDFWMDDFVPILFDATIFPWCYITKGDFNLFYDELKSRYVLDKDINEEFLINELTECVDNISSEWNLIPTDDLKEEISEDLQFVENGFYGPVYSQVMLLKYKLPIVRDYNEFIKNNDISEDELAKKAAYLIKFLDNDFCFYSRSYFSEDSCWAYPYENYDIRINIFLMEVDSVFMELNRKYGFSKIKPEKCEIFEQL